MADPSLGPSLGPSPGDVNHAWSNAVGLVEYDDNDQPRLLVIGPDRRHALLELVVDTAGAGTRVIHASRLRPDHFHLLSLLAR